MAREAMQRLLAVEPPRQPEPRQRDRQPRLLQHGLGPGLSTVGRDLDPLDPPAPRPRQPGQFVQAARRQRCPPDGNVMTDFASIA